MTEKQAEAWIREYRILEIKTIPGFDSDDNKRLEGLHVKLSDYRLSDPIRFVKKFMSSNGKECGQHEGPPPDEPNTDEELEDPPQESSKASHKKGKKRSQKASQPSDKQSTKPTYAMGNRVRSKKETEPVGIPVAWYNCNSKKNHQRRIYQKGPSDHYQIGKAKEWGLPELEHLPEVTSSKETILDLPMQSIPVRRQYNFSNIERIVAVVVPYSEKPGHESQLLTRPTYVLVKWKDLLPQHLKHSSLIRDCESWILKSKLLSAVSKTKRITLRGWIEDLRSQTESAEAEA